MGLGAQNRSTPTGQPVAFSVVLWHADVVTPADSLMKSSKAIATSWAAASATACSAGCGSGAPHLLCRGLLFSQRLTSHSLWYCVQVRGILEEYRIGRLKGGQTAQVGCGVALLHGAALPAAIGGLVLVLCRPRIHQGCELWQHKQRGGLPAHTVLQNCFPLSLYCQVSDPYASEPARHPALIVRSQKPMNSGEAAVYGCGMASAWFANARPLCTARSLCTWVRLKCIPNGCWWSVDLNQCSQ